MKRWVLVAMVAGLGLVGAAQAQSGGSTGANIAQVFELKDVLNKRGKIILGTDVASTLEFESEIIEWAVGRDDLLLEPVKSKGNTGLLYLRAKAGQGGSSLDVMLQSGEVARFNFSINSKMNEGARYIVRGPRPAPAATNGEANGLPTWLGLDWKSTVAANKDVFLTYVLSNRGVVSLTAEANKLMLFANRNGKATRLKYSLSRGAGLNAKSKLPAASSQTATLTVKSEEVVGAGELLVQWTLQDSNQVSYLVQQKINLDDAAPSVLRGLFAPWW